MIIAIVLVLFFIPQLDTYDIIEGLGGRGRGGRRGGRRGGGRGGGRGGHHHGGRRWYGGNMGYRYNRPPFRRNYPRYNPWWTSAYWFVEECKDGCTNIGNNNWGCQYPGNGPNDCIFANDCYGCGI